MEVTSNRGHVTESIRPLPIDPIDPSAYWIQFDRTRLDKGQLRIYRGGILVDLYTLTPSGPQVVSDKDFAEILHLMKKQAQLAEMMTRRNEDAADKSKSEQVVESNR